MKWIRGNKRSYEQTEPISVYTGILEQQYNVVNKKGEKLEWMWRIYYNDGHVGCPYWGYTKTKEEAKRQVEIWMDGVKTAMNHFKVKE